MARQKIVDNVYVDLTAEEEAEIAADIEAMDLDLGFVRSQRDGLLASLDWTQIGDVVLAGGHTAVEWATYRQALRDLPSTADRQSLIVWPEDPPTAKITRKTVAGQAAYDAAIASDEDDTDAAEAAYDTAYADTD
jgi:hypothetical protein